MIESIHGNLCVLSTTQEGEFKEWAKDPKKNKSIICCNGRRRCLFHDRRKNPQILGRKYMIFLETIFGELYIVDLRDESFFKNSLKNKTGSMFYGLKYNGLDSNTPLIIPQDIRSYWEEDLNF